MSPDDGGRSPGDPGELVRRRRELAKALHPDRGGDPAAFVAAMAALEREARGGSTGATSTAGRPSPAPRATGGEAPAGPRFAAPARGSAVHVTWRGRIRQVRRRAVRKLRRNSRYIDVTSHLERR